MLLRSRYSSHLDVLSFYEECTQIDFPAVSLFFTNAIWFIANQLSTAYRIRKCSLAWTCRILMTSESGVISLFAFASCQKFVWVLLKKSTRYFELSFFNYPRGSEIKLHHRKTLDNHFVFDLIRVFTSESRSASHFVFHVSVHRNNTARSSLSNARLNH